MTDHEVTDLFQRALDTPEPPLPDVSRVLTAGRAARRRRTVGASATALAAVLLAAAGTAGATGLLSAEPSVPPQRGIARGYTPHPTPNVTHFLPSRRPNTAGPDLLSRAAQLLDTLTHAVPPGYTVPKTDLVRYGGFGYEVRGYTAPAGPARADGRWRIDAHTDIYRDGRAGSLWVTWTNGVRYPPAGSACDATIPLRHTGTATRCSMTSVRGVAVRLDVQDLPDGSTVRYATAFDAGHWVTVSADQQGVHPGKAPLPAPPMSGTDLARLVTGPSLVSGD
ncbi:hypothetical protein AB0I55_14895 [Actinocatenispora sera]|uniref:Uncharacterized protein n=1 Tax=Actinocatenispora sera TaxID=390989 RepID=A0A810L9D8_9ACTN|nr:hypothetical protein [Actinocatenispora sera]BCJ30678.1 hypothetical protein Asera_47860 [Actinocatenispora sera]